jgi:hypothetical protein
MAPGDMASAKRTPKVSRISRDRTVAYARKQKAPAADGSDGGGADPDAPAPAADNPGPPPAEVAAPAGSPDATPGTAAAMRPDPAVAAAPVAERAAPPNVEPWPDATPTARPVDEARVRVDTVPMPVQASIGAPPAMPAGSVAPGAAAGVDVAEAPTRMPGPREIPGGDPGDPAPPPGNVPPGDSRSMRRRAERYEFALIYRIQTYVISRCGEVGTRGQWRVVEYPTSASASHAYAKECSRFVSEGFSDYRA